MLRTWEEKIKFKFGNVTNLEGCEVNVPGIPDDPDKNIEDCFHTMAQYGDTPPPSLSLFGFDLQYLGRT